MGGAGRSNGATCITKSGRRDREPEMRCHERGERANARAVPTSTAAARSATFCRLVLCLSALGKAANPAFFKSSSASYASWRSGTIGSSADSLCRYFCLSGHPGHLPRGCCLSAASACSSVDLMPFTKPAGVSPRAATAARARSSAAAVAASIPCGAECASMTARHSWSNCAPTDWRLLRGAARCRGVVVHGRTKFDFASDSCCYKKSRVPVLRD